MTCSFTASLCLSMWESFVCFTTGGRAADATLRKSVSVSVSVWAAEQDTDLLQNILRPVKVLLVWWQRRAGAAEGNSVWEEDEVEVEEATEVEVKGSSPPSCSCCCCCSSSGCCWSMASPLTAALRSAQSSHGPSSSQSFWKLHSSAAASTSTSQLQVSNTGSAAECLAAAVHTRKQQQSEQKQLVSVTYSPGWAGEGDCFTLNWLPSLS